MPEHGPAPDWIPLPQDLIDQAHADGVQIATADETRALLHRRTYSVEEIQDALSQVLDREKVSLWLPDSMPFGSIHPCDAGHIGRWLCEELEKTDGR